ncbi:MAG: hypothetical protein RIB60_10260 [Phycisphaerales bacterium]
MKIAMLTLAAAGPVALGAPIIGFVEDFNTDGANWKDVAELDAVYSAAGGPDGSGFISGSIADVYALDPTFGGIALRAHDEFDSSGDAFVGDWLAAGITLVSVDVRHDGGDDVGFFIRAARPSNSPAAVFFSPVAVASGQWTTLTFAIDENSPFYVPAGPPSPTFFQDVMGDVGNFQLGVAAGPNYSGNASVTFDLDNVRLLPTPASAGLLGLGGLVAARRRR